MPVNDTNNGINRTLSEWSTAFSTGNIDALVSLVVEDGEFWTHGMPAIVGRRALREAFATFFSAYSAVQAFDEKERLIGDGWALLRGIEFNTLTPAGGGDPVEYTQRALSVLRLDSDGRWRFARGMTNQETQENEMA
jgi:uncharacterized protein (TIGR02246 family)